MARTIRIAVHTDGTYTIESTTYKLRKSVVEVLSLAEARERFEWEVPAWIDALAETALETRSLWRSSRWLNPATGELAPRYSPEFNITFARWVVSQYDPLLRDALYATFNAAERRMAEVIELYANEA